VRKARNSLVSKAMGNPTDSPERLNRQAKDASRAY
jgi:hypothetical protein